MKMRNTLMAVTVMVAAGLSPVTQAAFTDDTAYAGMTGTINFGGTVTDQTPKWMWEVPNAGTPYQGYDININLGTSSGGKTTFAYTAMPDLTFLQGYLKSMAPNGGQGLQPVITLGQAGQEFKLVTGTVSSENLTATVKAKGVMPDATTNVEGVLQFDLAQGGVIAGTDGTTAKIQPAAFLAAVDGGTTANSPASTSTNAKYVTALTDATTLLANGADWATSDYSAKTLDKSKVWGAGSMSSYNVKKIYAAYSSVISNVKTVWTATEVPATWTADIGVTVTHQ